MFSLGLLLSHSYPRTDWHMKIVSAFAIVSSILTTILSATVGSETHSDQSTTISTPAESQIVGTKSSAAVQHDDSTFEVQVVVTNEAKSMSEASNQSSNSSNRHYCLNLTLNQILDNHTECLPPLPKELYFSDDNIVTVAAYSCMFVVAACGNLTVFITLFRNMSAKSRINLFIMHLAIADLIVTFVMLPLEIAWNSTVAWLAGDVACRLLTFFRAMGFYLSSCILVSISLDRYLAIMRPLSITDADTRARMMLMISWLLAIIASIPQSVIFHVERHPVYRWFKQCVTFNFFPTRDHELAYNLFSIIALYGLPLAIITSAYCVILCRISKKSRQSKYEITGKIYEGSRQEHGGLRRSGVGNIERAKSRTLKMTLVIVGAYVMCWTPYFVISAWYYFDRNSALKIDGKVQRGLFIFAVSNSCINPIVYGMFTIKFKRELIRCCYCLRGALKRRRQDDSNGIRRSLLFPLKRNSESSSSSRNNERMMRAPTHQDGVTSPVAQGCRYSFVSPLAEVKASSSRASLNSVGREDRVNFFALGREDRVSFGPSTSSMTMERSNTGNFSSRDDRANLNNFIRLGSAD